MYLFWPSFADVLVISSWRRSNVYIGWQESQDYKLTGGNVRRCVVWIVIESMHAEKKSRMNYDVASCKIN